jgi:hypothetical protein
VYSIFTLLLFTDILRAASAGNCFLITLQQELGQRPCGIFRVPVITKEYLEFSTKYYTVQQILLGQKTCPKHLEFYSKNEFEKLVHLVGFIIRICFTHRSTDVFLSP